MTGLAAAKQPFSTMTPGMPGGSRLGFTERWLPETGERSGEQAKSHRAEPPSSRQRWTLHRL